MTSDSVPPIHFFFENVRPVLKNRNKLKNFISVLLKNEEKQVCDLNYIFCTDQALLRINRKYLNHDFYTDVISFDLSELPNQIIADIYISIDRVKENALKLKSPFVKELHRVIFHGTLHLCGYNDKTISQKEVIRKKEDFFLNLYFKP
jgi:probable rRNA maturation factor